jgi:hypothetical protein
MVRGYLPLPPGTYLKLRRWKRLQGFGIRTWDLPAEVMTLYRLVEQKFSVDSVRKRKIPKK